VDNPADLLSRNALDEIYKYRQFKMSEKNDFILIESKSGWKQYIQQDVERRRILSKAHGTDHAGSTTMKERLRGGYLAINGERHSPTSLVLCLCFDEGEQKSFQKDQRSGVSSSRSYWPVGNGFVCVNQLGK